MNDADPLDAFPSGPAPLLTEWLPANDDPTRPLMTLATADGDGVDAQSLLLSWWEPDGFWFHTDSRSRKVAELAANPRVALVLAWPEQRRQLVVQGTAEPATAVEDAAAYATRGPYLQELAWLNTDDFAHLPEPERLTRWAAFAAEHDAGFAQPRTWVGYRVRPSRVTFWFGNPDTASRRVEYTLGEDGLWQVALLAG